jgi:aldehyde dehydrogenase (NAD+)
MRSLFLMMLISAEQSMQRPFMHQGQICMSVERIIVLEAVVKSFTQRLVTNVKSLGIGDPTSMGAAVIGPLIKTAKKMFMIRSVMRWAKAPLC